MEGCVSKAMCRITDYVELAKEYAINSVCSYKHAAIIISGGKIKGIGVNHYRTYHKGVINSLTTHAEADCIYRMDHGEEFYKNRNREQNRYIVIVVRVNKEGNLCDSEPCSNCISIMCQNGVKRVYYSTADGSIKMDHPRNLNGYITSAQKRNYVDRRKSLFFK